MAFLDDLPAIDHSMPPPPPESRQARMHWTNGYHKVQVTDANIYVKQQTQSKSLMIKFTHMTDPRLDCVDFFLLSHPNGGATPLENEEAEKKRVNIIRLINERQMAFEDLCKKIGLPERAQDTNHMMNRTLYIQVETADDSFISSKTGREIHKVKATPIGYFSEQEFLLGGGQTTPLMEEPRQPPPPANAPSASFYPQPHGSSQSSYGFSPSPNPNPNPNPRVYGSENPNNKGSENNAPYVEDDVPF